MPSSLRAHLSDLATSFADAVLQALRSASLDDLAGETNVRRGAGRLPSPGPTRASRRRLRNGRLPRRTPEQITRTLGRVLGLLKSKKVGLRAEEIRSALTLDVREMPRVLREGLKTKQLRSKGQKRATTYSPA